MDTFTVLAEPNRRAILDILFLKPQTVNMLVDSMGLSQPAVSKHLRVLREVDLVVVEPKGQKRWYGINPEPLNEITEWLAPYRQMWAHQLDLLEEHLDKLK